MHATSLVSEEMSNVTTAMVSNPPCYLFISRPQRFGGRRRNNNGARVVSNIGPRPGGDEPGPMAPGGGALSRDKPPRQPLRSCVRKQTRYGPNKSHAATKRVSINPESPCFLVFNSIATPDLFFADPSTVPSLDSEDTDLMIQENVPPLSSLSFGSITGPAANRVKLPPTEGPKSNTCEAADGPRQVRLLQEIENLSMGELKDKIREVRPRHPNRTSRLRLTVIDPLRPAPPLPS